MKYAEKLQERKNTDICPFCTAGDPEIIEETETMIVTPSRAPYHPHHIMIVPKRHVILLQDLNTQESKELFALIQKRDILLHKRHQDVVVYLKDGSVGGPSGKTVNHFHFHLIPDCIFGAQKASGEREFLDNEAFAASTHDIKKKFL